MTSGKKKIFLGIIHTSLGELQWLVPYFYLQKQKNQDCDFVLLFFSEKVYQKALKEDFHLREFRAFGTVIKKKHLFFFLVNHRKRIKYIFKDFWPLYKKSLAAAIRFCSPNATFYLYPHANALYSLASDSVGEEIIISKHDPNCFDYLIVNTLHDTTYWARRIDKSRILVSGAPAYSKDWIVKFRETENPELLRVKQEAGGRKIVAVFTRPADGELLIEDDYKELITSLTQEMSAYSELFFVFKPHPREEEGFLKNCLKNEGITNYDITDINPFLLSLDSYYSIHFWSSTITDSLAVGCPGIEYFRFHEKGNDKWLEISSGKYKSIYEHLGLCLSAKNRTELKEALTTIFNERDNILLTQIENFKKNFQSSEGLSVDLSLPERGDNLKKIQPSIRHWLQVMLSSMKSYFSGHG